MPVPSAGESTDNNQSDDYDQTELHGTAGPGLLPGPGPPQRPSRGGHKPEHAQQQARGSRKLSEQPRVFAQNQRTGHNECGHESQQTPAHDFCPAIFGGRKDWDGRDFGFLAF